MLSHLWHGGYGRVGPGSQFLVPVIDGESCHDERAVTRGYQLRLMVYRWQFLSSHGLYEQRHGMLTSINAALSVSNHFL